MAQINFSGSIGVPGSSSILGYYNVVMTSTDISNGYHNMPSVEYSNKFLNVTSSANLTATLNLLAVFNTGQEFVVQNNTLGGHSIQIIGAANPTGGTTIGTGVTIPNGATVTVVCDGTKYLTSAGGAVVLSGDVNGTSSATTVLQAQNGSVVFSTNSIEFANTVTTPTFLQLGTTTGNGQPLVVSAQNTSAATSLGGNLILASGTGTSGAGNLSLSAGGTAVMTINGATEVISIPSFGSGIVHVDGSGDLSSSAIFNSDIAGSAAISVSKLQAGTDAQILTNNSTPTPTWVSITGDITFADTGVVAVTKLQGNPVLAQVLGVAQDGYVLAWKNSATAWEATAISSGSTTLGGDVTGLSTSNTVGRIQNYTVSSTNPTSVVNGQYNPVLIWNPTLTRYDVRPLTSDDIGPGFTINSFGSSQTVEIGFHITAPVLTASYNATPASATITNTDGLTSPITLSSPYTSSGSLYNSTTFTGGNVYHTTTFTLQATSVGGVIKNATLQYVWEPRMFAGTGSANATATATANGANATLSTGDTVYNTGLAPGNTAVGQTFTVSGVGNKIYLLLPGGPYSSFFDTNAGAPFSMKAATGPISFVNQNGATVTMYLYESTNTLTTTPPQLPFAIKVIS